jgi:potassium/chloride transporter 9
MGDASQSIRLLEKSERNIRGPSYHHLPPSDAPEPTKNRLGTFFGVYIPTVLGIFGVVIFLRLSWITGQAGLINTYLMYVIAGSVAGLTVLSVSAIATNGQMKAGGTYYLISRSLGPEFGGSLGAIFFAANIIGCAFYVLGLTETIAETFKLPADYWYKFLYATALLIIVGAMTLIGANLFARASFVLAIMLFLVIVFAVISYYFQREGVIPGYTGPSLESLKSNLHAHYRKGDDGTLYDFRKLFGILFPSVTGIMTGSNMSGDLADPGKSLPIGSLAAGLTALFVYFSMIFTFSLNIANSALGSSYYTTQNVCFAEWVVVVGIICAVFSSALATLISAARILQALARDNIFPIAFFGVGSAKGDEPRRGVLLCWGIVQVLILVPNLNILAPFLSLLYLLSFCITNLACFVSEVTGLPNFRPTFKYFHWSTALAGTISSLGVMFFINEVNAGISLCVLFVLWIFIHFRSPSVQWGDVSQALIFHQVRKYLLRLNTEKIHVKVWRPGVLLLVSTPRAEGVPNLIEVTNSLKKGGLFIIANIVVGEWKQNLATYALLHKMWITLIKAAKWKAFLDLIIAPSVRLGVQNLVLSAGVGGMKPNTVVIGYYVVAKAAKVQDLDRKLPLHVRSQIMKFPDGAEKMSEADYVAILRDINAASKNLLIARNFEKFDAERMKSVSGVRDRWPHIGIPSENMVSIDLWIVEDFVSNFKNMQSSAEFPHTFFVSEKTNESFVTYSDTSALIIQLGYILHSAALFHVHSKLRVLALVRDEAQVHDESERLSAFLYKSRVKAEAKVISLSDLETDTFDVRALNQIIRENSANTGVAFFPLPPLPSAKKAYGKYVHEIGVLSEALGPMYLVRANEHVLTTEI